MFSISRATVALWLLSASRVAAVDDLRETAQRIRTFEHEDEPALVHASNILSDYDSYFKSIADSAIKTIADLTQAEVAVEAVKDEESELEVFLNSFRMIGMSFQSNQPSSRPSGRPSIMPTISTAPSNKPSVVPTVSSSPSTMPSIGSAATPPPSPDAVLVTLPPTGVQGLVDVTTAPTVENCNLPEVVRITQILNALDAVANPDAIRDNNTPQGLATSWLIQGDGLKICPDDPKLVQRWVLAVIYFSTNGNNWFKCSANPTATDGCGTEDPFVGSTRYLSPVQECAWAGISCINGCVTEIEFEENNLIGTIPSEIGLLSDLAIWGMERGGLTGKIPSEIGNLSNLIFLDLDFNELTGSLSSELLSLTSLTQLDINNNLFTGSIGGIGVFPRMEFLQLHDNGFTGTIPAEVASYSNLVAFTLHETEITGAMPEGVCDLLVTNGGSLRSLIADCSGSSPDLECSCCTDCRDT